MHKDLCFCRNDLHDSQMHATTVFTQLAIEAEDKWKLVEKFIQDRYQIAYMANAWEYISRKGIFRQSVMECRLKEPLKLAFNIASS